jgi:hypothetical protein
VQGGTNSSEFRIPDSELEGSVELRVPSPQASRLVPVPSDKILFPRRMLYVEAVLYVMVAATAFGLGYLAGRGSSAARTENSRDGEMQGVAGSVSLLSRAGAKRGDEGTVVIVLPSGRLPSKPLPIAGLQPGDQSPGDATIRALRDFGGAVARVDNTGSFTLSVPAAESYRILILSAHATRDPAVPLEQSDLMELGKYFEAPADLLQRSGYHWLTKDIRGGTAAIDQEFPE